MELRHLRYFLAVAEVLHFSRAAEKLMIAQPPLSQQIKQLEKEIGVVLFERTNRRVELTEAGKAFQKSAQRVLELTEQAVRTAQRVERGESGRLAVGFVGSAAYTGLPRAIRSFRRQYPGVELALRELRTPQQLEALLADRLDVGIVRSANLGCAEIVEKVLLTEEFIIALARGHRLARQSKVAVAALANDDFVLYPQEAGPGLYQQVLTVCQRAGFSPRPTQQAAQIPTIISLVAAGLGVALVPACVQSMRWQNVVYRRLADAEPHTVIALAWRRNLRSAVVRSFVEIVAGELTVD